MIGRNRTVDRSPHRLENDPCETCGRDRGVGRAHHYVDRFAPFGITLKTYESGTNYLCHYHFDEPVLAAIDPPIDPRDRESKRDGAHGLHDRLSPNQAIRAVTFQHEDRIALQRLEENVLKSHRRAPNGVGLNALQNIRRNQRNETVLITQEVWEAVMWWTVTALKNAPTEKKRSWFYDLLCRLQEADSPARREVLQKVDAHSLTDPEREVLMNS